MVRRVRSDDLELMITAITIQHQVGGNLAEILDSIAFTIRERVRIKGEIRTLTAQQRLSGYVVGFLPIGLVGVLIVIAPEFMEPMFEKPPELFGLPAGRDHARHRRHHDAHRLPAHPPHRRHRGLGHELDHRRSAHLRRRRPARLHRASSGRCRLDPVAGTPDRSSARCRPSTLEELELQRPFFDRTLRPLAGAAVGRRCSALTSPENGRAGTEQRAGHGRQPGRPAHGRLPRPEGRRRRRRWRAVAVPAVGVRRPATSPSASLARRRFRLLGFIAPGLLARPAHQGAPEGDPARRCPTRSTC